MNSALGHTPNKFSSLQNSGGERKEPINTPGNVWELGLYDIDQPTFPNIFYSLLDLLVAVGISQIRAYDCSHKQT